jgi:hypothetical protein
MSVQRDQLTVSAAFRNAAFDKDKDLVAMADRGESLTIAVREIYALATLKGQKTHMCNVDNGSSLADVPHGVLDKL